MNWRILLENPILRIIYLISIIALLSKYILKIDLPFWTLIIFSAVLYFKRHQTVIQAFIGSLIVTGIVWAVKYFFFT